MARGAPLPLGGIARRALRRGAGRRAGAAGTVGTGGGAAHEPMTLTTIRNYTTSRDPVASAKKVLLRCFVASEERYSWSAGGRHLLSSCLHLQRTHPRELLLVVGEAPAQRRRVEREVLFFEARRGGLLEGAERQQPLVRRGRPIVALADLGAS